MPPRKMGQENECLTQLIFNSLGKQLKLWGEPEHESSYSLPSPSTTTLPWVRGTGIWPGAKRD